MKSLRAVVTAIENAYQLYIKRAIYISNPFKSAYPGARM